MRQTRPGKPYPLGATFDGRGVNFAVFSRVATRVEVCLYDPADPQREIDRCNLPEVSEHVWHGYRDREWITERQRHVTDVPTDGIADAGSARNRFGVRWIFNSGERKL